MTVGNIHGNCTGVLMSKSGRLLGLALALVMLIFSGYMFLQTGDWVAAVFVLGSLGYALFFLSTARSNSS